jgi:hypothetical protein
VLAVLVEFVFLQELPHLLVGQRVHVLDAVLLDLAPQLVVDLIRDVGTVLPLELCGTQAALSHPSGLYLKPAWSSSRSVGSGDVPAHCLPNQTYLPATSLQASVKF